MEELKRLQMRAENERLSNDFKTFTLGVLVFSIAIFIALGEANTKKIIWYWAGFMGMLVVMNIVLDIIAHSKNKRIDR